MSDKETTTDDKSQKKTTETPNDSGVSREEFEALKKNFATVAEEKAKLEATVSEIETEKLKSQKKWQELADINEKKAKDAEDKFKNLQGALMKREKMSAIKEEAMKHGILPGSLDDLEVMDWSDVALESTSTGKINVLGAAKAVERFKASKPHWFKSAAANVNTNTPGVDSTTTTTVTKEALNKAELDAKKTGNWETYKKVHADYRKQIAANKNH